MNNRSQNYLISDNNDSFWKRRTDLEKFLAIFSVLVIILALCLIIALAIIINGRVESELETYQICNSEVCQEIEKQLLSSINTSIDPCDDFYSYVCSGWKKSNPIPSTESKWDSFNIVEERVRSQLSDILQRMNYSESVIENNVMNLYKGCMNEERREKIGVEPLKIIAQRLGGWPLLGDELNQTYHWEEAIAWSIRELGSNIIFSVQIHADEKNTTRNILYIDYSSLGIGKNQLLNKSNERAIRLISAYKKLIEETVLLLNSSNDDSIISKDIEALIEFETNIANYTRSEEDRRNPESLYHKWTISQFQDYVGSNMNVSSFINNIFRNITTVTNDMEIIVVEPEYMKNIAQLLETTEKRIIANYIGWRIINKFSALTIKNFQDKKFEFSKVSRGITKKKSVLEFCTLLVNSHLSHAVGRMYINQTFSEDVKLEIERMIEDFKDAFNVMLTLSDWMDIETKRKSKDKLKDMLPLIAYPPWLLDEQELNKYYENMEDVKEDFFFQSVLNIKKFFRNKNLMKVNQQYDKIDDWFSSPTNVNAYYAPYSNTISFPAGILQFPFYQYGLPNSFNYGAIGAVIGHEITHGFDDEGSKFDKFGNLREWWSPEIRNVFHNKTECFVNQYNSYVEPTTQMTLNGKNTLGENIADNGGIRAAFKAYQLYLTKYGNINNKILANLKLTPNQLFFVGFSYIWCANERKEYLEQLIEYNPHSPSQFRVYGTLSNNKDFHKAFNCRQKSKTFLGKKCLLW